jgi:hypothetical protein
MKTQKRTIVVFLLIFSLILTYLAPLVFAGGRNGNQNTTGQGFPLENQQQGPTNTTNQTGNYGGTKTGGQNQSGPGQPGYGNENNTAGDPHRYQYQRRYMNIDGAGNCTRIRSQYRNNATEETFEIFFNIDNAPTLQLSFLPDLNATVSQQYFSLIIEQLIEYNDINANGKYDHNDVIVSTLLMSNVTFTNITYTNSITPDGKTITIIETHTPDNLFAIVIYLVSEKTSFLNNIITPEEIKIDFSIIDYPFVNKTSQLALITQVETPFTITPEQNTYDEEQSTATQESGLNISSGRHSGFFSWANVATVDNTSYPVNVTVISETEQTFTGDNQDTYTQTQVIFSYPRGESIIHDPKIGVISLLENIIPSVLQFEYLSVIYLLTCLISGIVFYGIVYFRKNR